MEDLKEIDNIKENINSSNLIINDAKKILSSIRTETGKKKRKKYTLKQKAAVLNLIENKISRHEIERGYGINRKSIKGWESKKDQILNSLKKKLIDYQVEDEKLISQILNKKFLIWFHTCRRHDLVITSNQIIVYEIKITGYTFKNSQNAYICWVKRFLKRNNLTIRKSSHIEQKINVDIENITYIFLRKCIKERIDNTIYDNIECIVNLDETSYYIENPSKEICYIKGVKKVEIITYG